MENTCLFTGEVLTPETNEEHTILRSLGGRIRSRLVSCDRFNHRCGETLDPDFASVYAVHMNTLAPLLSAEHQTGSLRVDVPGEQHGLVLDRGALTQGGRAVFRRDANGRPNAVIAAEPSKLPRLARQHGMEGELHTYSAPATRSDSYLLNCPTVRPGLEVAALKASLLTFDHLLNTDPKRFTRSPALAEVRGFVKQSVNEGKINPEMCHRFSLGMQYDRLSLYGGIRKAMPFPDTPFEHFLLVAGNAAGRCIDIVWVVLGFDPFGFRVAHDWRGESFAFGVVNGVLKDTGFSEAMPIVAPDELLCHPTNFRSCLEKPTDVNIEEITSRRFRALAEAMYLVEMRAADEVKYNLVQSALCDRPWQRKVGTQVMKRLRGWYERTVGKTELGRAVAEVFRANARGKMNEHFQQRIDDKLANGIDWAGCLGIYRECLADLRIRFGLPSSGSVKETRTRTKWHLDDSEAV